MSEDNAYERQRAAKIAENKAKLAQLGLIEASRALLTSEQGPSISLQAGTQAQPRKKRRVIKEAEAVSLEPTRVSSRIRGEVAPSLQEAVAVAQQEAEEDEGLGRTRKGTARKRLTMDISAMYAAPFTLWSIGVTVWDLGHIHRGAWAHRYWSSSGCLFHHAYPVGYRASKVQFGRTYDMAIEAGPTGPIFKVTDQKSGVTFSGESPTKPWTDVCLAHRTGQRISGPLFFGFSDVVTQRAIASLYTPQELQAALQGARLESTAQTAEERAAKEFQAVEGIGEATGMALAFTQELGGRQHGSLAELKAWVQQSDANQERLREWLTTSSELPEATRKWPAWRFRMVPKILAALCSSTTSEGTGTNATAGSAAGPAEGGRSRRQARAAVRLEEHGRDAQPSGAADPAASDAGSHAAEQESGMQQRQGHSGTGRGGRGHTGVSAGPRAKENRPGNSNRTEGVKAAATEGGGRASMRQRKANPKYEQFVVELGE